MQTDLFRDTREISSSICKIKLRTLDSPIKSWSDKRDCYGTLSLAMGIKAAKDKPIKFGLILPN